MPRIILALCFEDVGLLSEPILDTPIGKFSIRQTIIYLTFGLIAVLAYINIEEMTGMIAAAVIFVIGITFFGRKVKTMAPEKMLIYLLFRRGAFPTIKKEKKQGDLEERGELGAEELNIPNVVRVASLLDAPVKLVGVLRNPQTGAPIAHTPFDVLVNGSREFSGTTDESGFFVVFFTPSGYGLFQLEIKPEKSTISQTIPVQVVPSREALGGRS